jgi:hypothetical protein
MVKSIGSMTTLASMYGSRSRERFSVASTPLAEDVGLTSRESSPRVAILSQRRGVGCGGKDRAQTRRRRCFGHQPTLEREPVHDGAKMTKASRRSCTGESRKYGGRGEEQVWWSESRVGDEAGRGKWKESERGGEGRGGLWLCMRMRMRMRML